MAVGSGHRIRLPREYSAELGRVAGPAAVRGASSASARLQARALASPRPELWRALDAVLAAPRALAAPLPTYRCLARCDGRPARIACVGARGSFRRLLELVGAAELEGADRSRPPWSPAALARLDADLIAAEIHPWAAERFRRAGWLILPRTVRWRGRTAALPPARPSESLKSDLRTVAAAGYSAELRDDADSWREFLCRIVVPYAHGRFQGRAVYPSRTLVRRFARQGELLFVLRGGDPVAAGCLLARRSTLVFALCGVRDGDRELVRRGALAALYQFVIERARSAGADAVDAGRTGPFLDAGVARYKLKWGFQPERDLFARLVAIRLDVRHEGLGAAFAAHPVLVDAGDRLVRFPPPS